MIGKWEALITVPTGGLDLSLTDGTGGPYTVTLPAANTYYHSSAGNDSVDLPAKMKALLEAAGGNVRTYTVTCAATPTGSGKYTIAVDSGTYSITWTDTAWRDAVGFDANITTQTTSTGANHAQGLWLPQSPAWIEHGINSAGRPRSNAMVSVAEDGTYSAYHGAKHRRNTVRYTGIPIARAIAADGGNAAYEQFWLDCVRGEQSLFSSANALRFHWDADNDATYQGYHVTDASEPMMQRLDDTFDGLWNIELQLVAAG